LRESTPYCALFALSRHITSRSSSVSCEGSLLIARPALFTQTSMWPCLAIAASNTRFTSARWVTSVTTASASPDSLATASSSAWRRAHTTSFAPFAPSCFASDAPMPPLAPVIPMTLSMRRTRTRRRTA